MGTDYQRLADELEAERDRLRARVTELEDIVLRWTLSAGKNMSLREQAEARVAELEAALRGIVDRVRPDRVMYGSDEDIRALAADALAVAEAEAKQ